MNNVWELAVIVGILCAYLFGVGLVSLVENARNRRALLVLVAWVLAAVFGTPAAMSGRSTGPTVPERIVTVLPIMFVVFVGPTFLMEMLVRRLVKRIAQSGTSSVHTTRSTFSPSTGQPQSPPSADQPASDGTA